MGRESHRPASPRGRGAPVPCPLSFHVSSQALNSRTSAQPIRDWPLSLDPRRSPLSPRNAMPDKRVCPPGSLGFHVAHGGLGLQGTAQPLEGCRPRRAMEVLVLSMWPPPRQDSGHRGSGAPSALLCACGHTWVLGESPCPCDSAGRTRDAPAGPRALPRPLPLADCTCVLSL